MTPREILGLKFVNLGKLLLALLVLFFCLPASLTADDAPLKPFHLQFKGYQLNPADGTYVFSVYLQDVPRPHVHLPDGKGEPKTLFKIGDTIGRFKIVSFTVKILPNLGDRPTASMDESELILQNMSKPEEKIALVYRRSYDIPEAGLPPETK